MFCLPYQGHLCLLTLILTSWAFGGATVIVSMHRGLWGSQATAALHVISWEEEHKIYCHSCNENIMKWTYSYFPTIFYINSNNIISKILIAKLQPKITRYRSKAH